MTVPFLVYRTDVLTTTWETRLYHGVFARTESAQRDATRTPKMWRVLIVKLHCGSSSCSVVNLKGLTTDSEQTLISALSQHPVSITFNADQSSFQLFKIGVLTAVCVTMLDHGVFVHQSANPLVAKGTCWDPSFSDWLGGSSRQTVKNRHFVSTVPICMVRTLRRRTIAS